jgi:hypothetical protein
VNRRNVAWIALAAVVVITLAIVAWPGGGKQSDAARVRSVSSELRQAYIDKFGPSILLKPESGGLGILVWGLPAAALVLGAGGLVLALRRWRREPHLHPTDADRELVHRARP